MMKKYLSITMLLLLYPCLLLAQESNPNWLQQGLDKIREATGSSGTSLSESEITQGLKEALKTGTDKVVSGLGREDGYYLDQEAHIPLPESLRAAQDILKQIGMSDMLDDLELRMNRAAEKATPRAREMFVDAVSRMTLEDAMSIYNGPNDAATRYFQDKMSSPLSEEFTPVVRQSLDQVGAVQTYDRMMSRYKQIPLVPDISADLTSHVVNQSIETIFDRLARQEAAIRNDPASRTTDLLKKVFGH